MLRDVMTAADNADYSLRQFFQSGIEHDESVAVILI